MEKDNLKRNRENGIYYTPNTLAEYLAEPLIDGENISILDPAYGEGSLLLAAESVFGLKASRNTKIDLFGCDIHPVNGLLQHLPQANLKELDFFDFPTENKFDVILTNPPYISRPNQKKDLVKEYRNKYEELDFLHKKSDYWAYFLIKAVSHLQDNGSMGVIIPWAFLQANYAQNLRKWLLNRFKSIKVLALNTPYFKSAGERVILLWMEKYGKNTDSIEFAYAKDLNCEIVFKKVGVQEWLSPKVVPGNQLNINQILGQLTNKFGFSNFENHAKIRIGVVTGANSYFIRSKEELRLMGMKVDQLIPILTNVKELPDYITSGAQSLKRLFILPKNNNNRFKDLIREGIEANFHKRAHCNNRTPWYSINPGETPDAFFPYRIGKIPYMVINHEQVQSTNSIHRIYFNGVSKTEMKWIHISLLSIYGQLSLEINAKTYGRGMLKMEPGALRKVLVLKRKESSINKVFRETIQYLANNQKHEAVELASNFLSRELKISDKLRVMTRKALNEIRETRTK